MTLMTRDQLLTREELKREKVELGEDKYVFVTEMTGNARDKFENSLLKKIRDPKTGLVASYEQATENFRAKLAVNTICDENGILILKPEDYLKFSESIGAKSLEKIIEKANELNGIGAKDQEEIIKNSVADQVGNSSSDSVGK
jgi:DNA-directed RNA polymerase alpha subunit